MSGCPAVKKKSADAVLLTLIGLEYLKTITGILEQKINFEWCKGDRLSDAEILTTTPGEH